MTKDAISCICNDGFNRLNDKCVPNAPKCPSNQIWNAIYNKCVCDNNCYNKGNDCFPCPKFSKLGSDGKCVCEYGFIYNSYNDQCVQITCPVNSSPLISSNGVLCVCDSGYGMNSKNFC